MEKMDKIKSGCVVWDVFNEIVQYRNKKCRSITKILKEDGTVLTDFNDIAQALSKEYVLGEGEQMDKIKEEIDSYSNKYLEENQDYEMQKVNNEEVTSTISNVKKCKNLPNSVPKRIFKTCADVLCRPIRILFNAIFSNYIVTQAMKIATCTPLYKGKGKFTCAGSYRAIFHLSCITKIFECIIYNRLTEMTWDKLCNEQHGCRPGRSCETATALFSQKIHEFIDKRNGKAVAVFVDFAKAFDTVNRVLLMKKLMHEFQVEPYLVKTFASYFTGRKFKIQNLNNTSDYFSIDNGVPAGSKLGSLLFSLFINDVGTVIDSNMLLYADDMTIYTSCENLEQGIQKINEDLDNLAVWCVENGIKINVSKTKYMCFHKKNDYRSKRESESVNSKVMIGDQEVEKVDIFKYLGIQFDSTLSFKTHYKQVEVKICCALGRMYSLKRLISKNKIKIFMSAFVISIIDYGITIWAVQTDRELQKIQDKINRFIQCIEYPAIFKKKNKNKKLIDINVSNLLRELKLYTIFERRKLAFMKFVFKFR